MTDSAPGLDNTTLVGLNSLRDSERKLRLLDETDPPETWVGRLSVEEGCDGWPETLGKYGEFVSWERFGLRVLEGG